MPTAKKSTCRQCGKTHRGFKDVCLTCERKNKPRPLCPICGRELPFPRSGGSPFCSYACSRINMEARRVALAPFHKALRLGVIHPAKGQVCSCGKPAEVLEHRHYLRPLQVTPCCKSCNTALGISEDSFEAACMYLEVTPILLPAVAKAYDQYRQQEMDTTPGCERLTPREFSRAFLKELSK